MLNPSTIVLQSTVNFSLYAPALLGAGYQGAKVLAIMDYELAQIYINPGQQHAAVYPELPDGTPNDFTAYPYLKIRTASGTTTAVGLPWIIDETFEVAQRAKLVITVDSASPQDQSNIRAALSAIGIKNFTIATATG